MHLDQYLPLLLEKVFPSRQHMRYAVLELVEGCRHLQALGGQVGRKEALGALKQVDTTFLDLDAPAA